MKKSDYPANFWIPVAVGDFWTAQCLSTREFVAVGRAPFKPLTFTSCAAALNACDNAQRGVYDSAPPSGPWRVVSNGVTVRNQRVPSLGEMLKLRIEQREARARITKDATGHAYETGPCSRSSCEINPCSGHCKIRRPEFDRVPLYGY